MKCLYFVKGVLYSLIAKSRENRDCWRNIAAPPYLCNHSFYSPGKQSTSLILSIDRLEGNFLLGDTSRINLNCCCILPMMNINFSHLKIKKQKKITHNSHRFFSLFFFPYVFLLFPGFSSTTHEVSFFVSTTTLKFPELMLTMLRETCNLHC